MSMFIGEYFTHESIDNIIPLPASFLHKLSYSYSHLLLFRDMNFPHIDWNNISTDKGADDCNYEFLESIRDCFWSNI
jgi:hypothetical protein